MCGRQSYSFQQESILLFTSSIHLISRIDAISSRTFLLPSEFVDTGTYDYVSGDQKEKHPQFNRLLWRCVIRINRQSHIFRCFYGV